MEHRNKNGQDYFAEILDGVSFTKPVPIYHPDGGFYESIDYGSIRNSLEPSWRNSIRKISDKAFNTIVKTAKIETTRFTSMSYIESSSDPYNTLHLLNEKYKQYSPETRPKLIEAHTDRGSSVTKALKVYWEQNAKYACCGFEKNNGEMYIEAHHITEVAACEINSLCSENIILVCPNCHREIHYGKNVKIVDRGESLYIETTKHRSLIHKNTLEYLIKLID